MTLAQVKETVKQWTAKHNTHGPKLHRHPNDKNEFVHYIAHHPDLSPQYALWQFNFYRPLEHRVDATWKEQ